MHMMLTYWKFSLTTFAIFYVPVDVKVAHFTGHHADEYVKFVCFFIIFRWKLIRQLTCNNLNRRNTSRALGKLKLPTHFLEFRLQWERLETNLLDAAIYHVFIY